jgi:hypothetical protein
MFRFTIRDLLWLMVVVALAVGWWVERDHSERLAKSKATLEDDVRDIWQERDPFAPLNPEGKLDAIKKKYFPQDAQ